MEYKQFHAEITFNEKAKRFDGIVEGASQDLTFTGKSVAELEENFKAVCDKHVDRCQAKREDPYKTFSGHLILRISREMHREAYRASKQADYPSLNKWLEDAVSEKLARSKKR